MRLDQHHASNTEPIEQACNQPAERVSCRVVEDIFDCVVELSLVHSLLAILLLLLFLPLLLLLLLLRRLLLEEAVQEEFFMNVPHKKQKPTAQDSKRQQLPQPP